MHHFYQFLPKGICTVLRLGFLVILLAVVATPAAAQALQMKLDDSKNIVLSGRGWSIVYGSPRYLQQKALLVTTETGKTYFSHGGWLRLFDRRGIVVGRWLFPGEIRNLIPEAGDKVRLEYGLDDYVGDSGKQFFGATITFDPSAPVLPRWDPANLRFAKIPVNEIGNPAYPEIYSKEIRPEDGRKALARLDQAVRRDPLSPWFRFARGKLLRALDDPRAKSAFEEILTVPVAGHGELFWMVRELELLGQAELAREVFERAYRHFIEQGNDPRMLTGLINRLILGLSPLGVRDTERYPGFTLTPEIEREWKERIYRIGPYAEGANIAWSVHAEHLRQDGSDEAELWQQRAGEASENVFAFVLTEVSLPVDIGLLVFLGSFFGCGIFLLILFLRYHPSLKSERSGLRMVFTFRDNHYWTGGQRIAFLCICILCWYSIGVIGIHVEGIGRLAAMPLSLGGGNLAAPQAEPYFRGLPDTPERSLLRAIAAHHRGDLDRAEAAYRKLPQFPQSWNNLGVILKERGDEDEARKAFERALSLDPNRVEAAWNLGQNPQNFWTDVHQKYRPESPMLAPPSRQVYFNAFFGGSRASRFLRAFLGPFASEEKFTDLFMSVGIIG